VVTVRDDPMTPIPRQDSDDSNEGRSDATESDEDKDIYSMCYEYNDKLPIQMKENGTCHGRCFYCHRRQRHLVCAAVNPDKMIDGIPHSWCEICRQYVTSGTLVYVMDHAHSAVPE
jgi:L-lysine 2,3-aminomutase